MFRIKNCITAVSLILLKFIATAQTPTPSSAQPNFKLIFEKTYLHTDRDVYAQGDTLWFKAYLVNAQGNTPSTTSGNLHVDLVTPDAGIFRSEIIRMDNGLGNGDIELTDSIPPGKYRLRAYTNWMRNFGDNFIFEKDITILNTQAIPMALGQTKTAIVAAAAKNNTKSKAAAVAPAPVVVVKNLDVRFYPEGGSMVEGISSMVAVKAENSAGKGMVVSGAVLSAAGDTVSVFHCDSLGMGVFAMLPLKGQTYHAVVNRLAFGLPAALSQGAVLQVKQVDTLIHVVVSTTAAIGTGYTLSVKHTGLTVLSQPLTLQGPQTALKIPAAMLPEGISAITLYNTQGKPECERLVYVQHPQKENTITVKTGKKTYKAKEQVSVQISAKANSNLSMAVVDAAIVPDQEADIVSYLLLQSEVKGNIEQASRYFDTTNVNRAKQLDLLLMTQGWRDFVWRRLADTAIRISYAAENGINVSGRMWEEVRNKMLPNLNISLYAPGARGTKLYAGATDSAGHFNFPGLMLYGKQNIKLSSVNDKGDKKGTFLVDTILPLPVKPNAIKIAAVQEEATDSLAKAAMEQKVSAIKKANISGVTKLKEVKIAAKRQGVILRNGTLLVPWGPDQIFNITPKDYTFRTLEWYLIQNAKGARPSNLYHLDDYTKEDGGGYTMKIPPGQAVTQVTGLVFSGPKTTIAPIFFVNGQEYFMDEFTQAEAYRNQFFNMPMNKFKSVVIKHMIIGGTADKYIIYLTLTDDALTDNPGSLSVDIPGYYQARTFYQPNPTEKVSLADFRSTIHWEPNVKTDATGKAIVSFNTGSGAANTKIFVQGLTEQGAPLAAAVDYNIK